MTPTQKARLIGFNASLAKRGVSVFLQPDDTEFTALVQVFVPDNSQYQISKEVGNRSKIHIRRSDYIAANVEIVVGSVFEHTDAITNETWTHRVTEIADHPTDIKNVYTCESSPVPS